MRRGGDDRRYVGNHEGEPSGNDAPVELRETRATKIATAVAPAPPPNVLPEDGGLPTGRSSAVDEVVKKLWNDFSLSEGTVGNSATARARKDPAVETGDDPKRPASVARTKTPGREAASPHPHSPHETPQDRSDSPQEQTPSGKQNGDDGGRGRQDGRGRSR